MINTKRPPRDTLWAGAIFTLIYAAWAVLVSSNAEFIQNFDKTIINLVCNNDPANVAFAKTFTNLGNTSTILIETIILFIILIVFKQYPYAWFTAGTMIAANGYNWVIKHAVERARPAVHHLVYADGFSFPSGHSVGSAALFGILIVLTILLIKNKFWKTLLIIIWALFPLLIGYTRIFVHVHYPSDVFGGWLEGITFVLLGYSFLYHYYIEVKLMEQRA
ncbi:phosphatase PAP2 family protein [Lactobacillus xujianguonis]|uniref:Phosphatase PAP2 family protein n=1 Tax=Lactobacillus xujianguonis TaxID=2495899 RepID=A0A437SUM7_9LACO|nr:phosphatase PAP2 family protein [Lactobacillus xujianguonis]RVU70604.1 phosphatase PAP2 family protein [Lactobacillus xujianguonis]